jgi:hypothetical protein
MGFTSGSGTTIKHNITQNNTPLSNKTTQTIKDTAHNEYTTKK